MVAERRAINRYLALVVLLVVASPVLAGDVTISFVSDESWAVSSMLSDGSIGVPLGAAQCICRPPGGCPCCWTTNTALIPGACWVWKPGTTSATVPVDLQGVFLGKTFDIPGTPDSGVLYLAADDFAELRVNGVVVGLIGSISDYGSAAGAQAGLTRFDLTPFLVPGRNEVLIRGQNGPGSFTGTSCDPCTFGQNPTGVLLGGTLSYNLATPTIGRTWGRVKVIYR